MSKGFIKIGNGMGIGPVKPGQTQSNRIRMNVFPFQPSNPAISHDGKFNDLNL